MDSVTGDALTDLLKHYQSGPEQPGIFTIPICAPIETYKVNDIPSWQGPNGVPQKNYLLPFPDATKDHAINFAHLMFKQCQLSVEYKNETDGEPSWHGQVSFCSSDCLLVLSWDER